MSHHLTDEEQLEQIKLYWKKYGNYIFAALLVAFLSYWGYKWYQDNQVQVATQASLLYDEMVQSAASGDVANLEASSNKLLSDFEDTIYAALTRMVMAKRAVDSKDYDNALMLLKDIYEHTKFKELRDIAMIRAARIYMVKKELDQALLLLDELTNKNLMQIVHMLKADIYHRQDKLDDAKKQYGLALQDSGKLRNLVLMQAQELGLHESEHNDDNEDS